MYELRISQEAISQLSKLERPIVRRIMKKLEEAKADPHRFFKRLSDSRESKIRVGDYRAIALILEKEKILLVSLVGHRKKIYK